MCTLVKNKIKQILAELNKQKLFATHSATLEQVKSSQPNAYLFQI